MLNNLTATGRKSGDDAPAREPRIARLAVGLASLALSACAGPLARTAANATGDVPITVEAATSVCENPDNDVLSTIIRVATDAGADGSGVVVSRNLVLTAAHVLEDARFPLVYIDEKFQQAALLATDPGADLALLAVDTGNLPVLPISAATLDVSEPVWAVGFPLALNQATTRGVFQSNDNGRLFTSAPIKAGNSGGGLMRCTHGQYELAGMVRGYGAYWRGDELISLENELSISVPAQRIQKFINDAGMSTL